MNQIKSVDGCKFVISKTIVGKKLTESQARECRSRELKGFVSKVGKKISARLVLEDNQVQFKFAPWKPNK